MRHPATVLLLLFALPAFARELRDEDLAPIPLGAPDRAREPMARREWARAAALVTAPGPGPTLVRGWLLLRAGDGAAAARALERTATDLPQLADLARALRAEALLAANRPEEADREAAGVATDSPHFAAARRTRARAQREAGKVALARVTYQAIIDSEQPDEVPVGLLGLGRLEAADGHPERALALLRRLDVEAPTHWAAAAGRKEAAALVKAHPKLEATWATRPPAEHLDRAEALLDAHRNEEAAAAITALGEAALDDAQRCRALYVRGRALRKLRAWKAARPLLEAAVPLCITARHAVTPWVRFLAGAAADRLGDEAAAAEHYRRLLDDHADHRLSDDGGYEVVRHLLADKDDPDAARDLARRLATERPEGDTVPDAVFAVTLDALLRKDLKRAREMLELEATLPIDPLASPNAGRAAYWRARVDLEDGRTDAAAGGFRSVLATHPFTWYALLAYARLRELDAAAAQRVAATALGALEGPPTLPGGEGERWRLEVPARLPAPVLERVLLLVRLGLDELALTELSAVGLDGDDELRWFAAWMLDRTGVYHRSHDILRRDLPMFRRFPPAGALRKHWRLAFPRPFEAAVDAAAKGSSVERTFLWALMREESAFNPGAESFANAQGLMQLMVPTAKRMANKDDGAIDRARLADPALNLRLAARYIRFVYDKVAKGYVLVPAAYNAGESALQRWRSDRGSLPLDLFVESIPFDETRAYLKRVVSSWATYLYLYGKAGENLLYLPQKLP